MISTALVLAAGRATRLHPLTERCPKSLLSLGEDSIIGRLIQQLIAAGIGDVWVVDGFEGDALREAIGQRFPGASVRFVRNDVYQTTNNAYSLWCARRLSGSAFVLIDGDLVVGPGVVEAVLGASGAPRCALRTQGGWGEEEMKVVLDGPHVAQIGKHLDVDACAGEAIGMTVFDDGASEHVFSVLEERITAGPGRTEWYEAAFQEMIFQHARFHIVDLGARWCVEVDTIDDLEEARRHVGRGDR